MKLKTSIIVICTSISLNAQMICPELPCYREKLNFLNVDPSANFTLQGDYLYWTAYADTLDWGGSYVSFTADFPSGSLNGRDKLTIYHAEFDWNSGFRVSGGFSICSWDNMFRWTYFNTKGSDEVEFSTLTSYGLIEGGNVQSVGVTIWPSGNLVTSVENLQTQQKLLLNCLDWEMGKSLYLTQTILFRPYLGVRGAQLNQKMDISFENNILVGTEIASSLMQLKNKFFGIGPRIGADGKWHINSYFSIFATTALSLLGGKFSISENERFNLSTELENFINSENRFTIKTFKPAVDVGIGLEFFYDFFCGAFATELDLGYEFHYWPEQTQLYRLYSEVRAVKQVGDVEMHGLSLRGAFYF